MMLPLKIVFVLLLVTVAPILFYKLNKLLASVFLKERDVSPRWKVFMRINLGLVVLVYVLVGAGIGNAVLGYLDGSGRDPQLISRDMIAAEPNVKPLMEPQEQQKPLPPVPHSTNNYDDHDNDQDGHQDGEQAGHQDDNQNNNVGKQVGKQAGKRAVKRGGNQPLKGYQPAVPAVDGFIHLGDRNFFGVNWEQVPEGLKIVRIGPGPMKQAGIQIDDIITHIDLQPLEEEAFLLERRNDVFKRKTDAVQLTIMRGPNVLKYRMVR